MPPKRAAFTADERRALRAHKAEHSKLTQKDLSQWFADKFGKPIQQSTVSEILSTRWSHLDEDEQPVQGSAKRFKPLAYPDLDRALAEWVLRAQKDVTITGDVVRVKAHQLWQRLPQYRDLEEPQWSTGWLDKFKKRHGIKQWQRHGEAASVNEASMAAELVS